MFIPNVVLLLVIAVLCFRIAKLKARIADLEAQLEPEVDYDPPPRDPCCDQPFDECPHGKGFQTLMINGRIVTREEMEDGYDNLF